MCSWKGWGGVWQAGVITAESPRQVSLGSWAIRGHRGESFAMTSYQGWDSNWMGGFSQITGAPSPRRAFLPHHSNPQAAEDETAGDASRSERERLRWHLCGGQYQGWPCR